MSELSRKYGISEEAIKKMIADGVISCTWAKYEEVISTYRNLSGTYSGLKLVDEVSERTKVPERTIYTIIAKFR